MGFFHPSCWTLGPSAGHRYNFTDFSLTWSHSRSLINMLILRYTFYSLFDLSIASLFCFAHFPPSLFPHSYILIKSVASKVPQGCANFAMIAYPHKSSYFRQCRFCKNSSYFISRLARSPSNVLIWSAAMFPGVWSVIFATTDIIHTSLTLHKYLCKLGLFLYLIESGMDFTSPIVSEYHFPLSHTLILGYILFAFRFLFLFPYY